MHLTVLFTLGLTALASALPVHHQRVPRAAHHKRALRLRDDAGAASTILLTAAGASATSSVDAAAFTASSATSFAPSSSGVTPSASDSAFSTASASFTGSSSVTGSAAPSASASASGASASGSSAAGPASSSTGPASSAAPSATAAPPASDGSKLVVAHMMVGNTFPYTVDSWAKDIALAHSVGIDGFALNLGLDAWQSGHVADAFTAAKQSGTGFKLFFSFDMSVFPCSASTHVDALRNYITTYTGHPNALKVDGKVFASTFAGEACTFGQGSVAAGWRQFTAPGDVHFVPSFFVDPAKFGEFDGVMDGDFNFNSGWPISLTTASANSLLGALPGGLSLSRRGAAQTAAQQISAALAKFVGATDTDTQHARALASMGGAKKTYMAAVSPWFFTHYSPATFNKNWIYLADSHLYPARWDALIAARDKVDIVEIVTWNDYGESHYLRDPGADGAQPNSQAWVDGMSHQGWLDMTAYYATAFKTGKYPAVAQDKLYLWARPHAKAASAPDSVSKPTNFELTEDTLWAVVHAKEAGTVTLNGQTFDVPAGATKLSVPLAAGAGMRGTLARGGATVVDVSPEFTFSGAPESYNFNAFVAFGAAKQ